MNAPILYGTQERRTHGTGETLDDIVKRTKLPISVWYEADGQEWLSGRDGWVVSHRKPDGWEHYCSPSQSSVGLKRTYLDLVSTLTDPAAHALLARTAASLSAAANSPVTPGVSSSSTAAPAAVDAPVPPHGASAAEFTPLGSAASPSGVR